MIKHDIVCLEMNTGLCTICSEVFAIHIENLFFNVQGFA